MRILHLAYEDPARPGSGAGAIRTREINRRLSARHDVTVLVPAYPGAQPRVEDGICWVPVGSRTGTRLDRLAYCALVGNAIRQHPHDLLVDDVGAPFGASGPLFTGRPVIASVQCLFARQLRVNGLLPFDWADRARLPLYRRFIAVSNWLAKALRERRRDADVRVIPNGVSDQAFATEPGRPEHLLFVGRLDSAQKGCDLLLTSYARICAICGEQAPPLLIVGKGPDRARLEQRVQQLGLSHKVIFRTRVDSAEKYRLMAHAYAVLMPSRFETFSLTAAESQAVGAPLVACNIEPLREFAGGGALLVPPDDIDAFVHATLACIRDQTFVGQLRRIARRWARRYRWDALAAQQEAYYVSALQYQGRMN